MTSIQKIVRMAVNTFSLSGGHIGFQEKNNVFAAALAALQESLKSLTADDVCLHKSMEKTKSRIKHTTYIEIFENSLISVGIFVLHPGAKIPLHDHPNMFGLLKVLHGKVRITSYNVCQSVQMSSGEVIYKAKLSAEDYHSRFSHPALLSPSTDNIHEISFADGENGQDYAAFIDILSPPYYSGNSEPECFYYKKLEKTGEETDSGSVEVYHLLNKTNIPPADFYTSNVPYYGTRIKDMF